MQSMISFTKPNGHKDLSFVFKTRESLNRVEIQRKANVMIGMRKKWAAAAIIALASGSTVFLAKANTANAATEDPNSSNVQMQVTKQDNKQTENNSSNVVQAVNDAVQNNQNKQANNKTEDNQTTQASQQTQTNQTDTQTQTAKTNTQATAQSTAKEGLPQPAAPANQADHVKGNVQSAWDQGYKGQGTVVAVIDSGADPTHKDFQTMPQNPKLNRDEMQKKIDQQGYGKYVNEKFPYVYNYADRDNDYITSDDTNPNDSPHGQHVSGIIAADGQPNGNQQYVVGVAPEAQLMQLRVFGQFSDEKTDDVAKAIYDATNLGADVIQMSLGQGVADQQFTNIEQKAVQYAINHGVFVSISASNNGNSASVDNPSNVIDANYQSGSAAGNYEPLNSSTVANPAASKNALTVAAETSDLGANSDMAYFSSWGPVQDMTLKPDLSAPGYQVVSTVNHNQYQTMSGTSMASPFAAGSAALVLQRLKRTNPELKGAQLVAAVKALLMNSAKPQTQNGYTTPVSPRRQGAGQIDVGAATAAPVYVTTDDGTSSVSLHQVGENTDFTSTFHNLTDQAQTYTFSDLGGGYTEKRDSETGVFHDVQLAGAQVNGENTFVLAPKETKQVKYSLNLTGLTKNQLVEGFLRFTNNNDHSTVYVPYLAYYGDLTSENVFDQNANDAHPDIQGNRFVNEKNYPRGIADQESLKELVNVDGDYNWQEVAKLYESGKVAFSPNNDQKSDLLKPYTYLKQNVKDLKVEILDAKGNVVRVVADVQGVDKSYDEDGVTKDTSLSVSMRDNPDAFEWDGKVYNTKTGKMETAKYGNYTYRFVATLWNKGPHQVQSADFPVVVDTVAPTLSNVKYDATTHTVSGNYADTGAGFTNYSYATVTVNDKVFGYKLNDGQSGFDNSEKTKGHFAFVLGADAQRALSDAENKLTVALSDVADNTVAASVVSAAKNNQPAVSVWNATDGLKFDQNSKNFNKQTNTYTLVGGANQDFYLNGRLVQVHNGKYEAPVKANTTELVFSSDQAGRNVLKEFSTVTPKAFFNWQETDTFSGNFGVMINSVKTNHPDDVVVQAAVPKGNNVKAFAKDYFTGELYTADVNNGVATFHVHTSISKGTDGVYKRALLTGWTEVDGPTFNDKQETNQGGVASTNHLGVFYFENAPTRTVYTNRNDLGITVQDEAAQLDLFGPDAYPGHAPSSLTTRTDPNKDIHFDYINDNDTTRFGQNAVVKGYYDPTTKKFTVIGKVDADVTSLTVLGDNPNEDAPQNQVRLGQDGKFAFTVTAENAGQRPIAYFYKTRNGQTVRGTLNLIIDTVAPTLKVDQVNGNDLELWTNNPKFVLSGTVNDNLDGYKLYVNGNNIYREFENSGYNRLAGLNTDAEFTNPYGEHAFSQEENLNDDNNNLTTHVFTVYAVDQIGNKVEKKLTVHFDPNYVAPTNNPDTGNTDNTGTTVDTTPNNPAPVVTEASNVSSENTENGNSVLTGKAFKLLHNAFLYNKDGEVALTADANKSSLLRKGQRITALDNARVVTIKGVHFYRVGNNQFVKVANTVLQAGKRLQLKHNAYVYDEKGQVVKKQGEKVLLKKGKWISALNNADKFVFKGQTFYKLANGQFVKVANTEWQKPKKVKLTHSAFVYDEQGKRVKKSKMLRKGQTVLAANNAEKFVIKGQTYYQVGKNYVKVANTL